MTKQHRDGELPAALKTFHAAISRLCDRQLSFTAGRVLTGPSLYRQLQDDLAGQKGSSKTPAKSQPPIWLDNADLLMNIDRTTRGWIPKRRGTTPELLHNLAEAAWRPQDTARISGMAAAVAQWCDQIVALLNPQSVKTIEAACPTCGKKTVYRKDTAGDVVRQPALRVITAVGCSCQACGASWTPDRYLFLCRLLGFELPEGVLE